MPSVADSIIGTLGQISGISGRRAEDGLTAQRSQELAIKNEASRKMMQDDEDASTIGELEHLGYLTIDTASGKPKLDAARLGKENPELFRRFFGPEANRFLKTAGPNGPEPIELDGIEAVPGGLVPNQNPVDEQTGSLLAAPAEGSSPTQVPDRFMIKLKTKDGRVVPATQNASAAPDDTLITMTADDLNKIADGRLGRIRARGGLDNSVTMNNLGLSWQEQSDALLQDEIIKNQEKLTGGDPVGGRELMGIINDLHGEDLTAAAKDAGVDLEATKAEAAKKWADAQAKERAAAEAKFKVDPDAQFQYQSLKELYTAQLERTNKALADYENTPAAKTKAIDDAMIAMSKAESKPRYTALGEMNGKTNPKDPNGRSLTLADKAAAAKTSDPAKAKLIEARDAAQKALANLKEPALVKMDSGAPPPKFELTEDNIRDAIRGKIGETPTPEQTAALTKYAKENGVQTAQDIAKLPNKNDAMALSWIIAANSRGTTSDQKIAIFDKLANFARTGDTKKSPIDAKVAITGARVAVAGAVNDAERNRVMAENNASDNAVAWARLGLDGKKYALDLQQFGYTRAKDVGAATTKLFDTYTSKVLAGAMGAKPGEPQSGDVIIKDSGPTADMNIAMNGLATAMNSAPPGSPEQLAASEQFLQAFSVYAASAAAMTGKPAFWDWQKGLTNFFLREGAAVPVGNMVANLQFEYKNGRPEKFRILEAGPGSDRSEIVAGAETIDKFMGPGYSAILEKAVVTQQAVNLLNQQGKEVNETSLPEAMDAIRKKNGMQ